MTSDSGCFVWIWLPGETEPVVAGRLEERGGQLAFVYGRSYLARENRVSIFPGELPLSGDSQYPSDLLAAHGCIRDGAPDAWGQRVILNRMYGAQALARDTGELPLLTYLMASGSDRVGALDFQASATDYVARDHGAASLDDLLEVTRLVEAGLPLPPALNSAVHHGTSLGGARPKATIDGEGAKYIAKFSLAADNYDVVKAEFVAMRLAALAGLDVAPVGLERAANKDVLLVERFDREPVAGGWARRRMISALTLLGLDEIAARYASYEDIAGRVQALGTLDVRDQLRELFGRITFNILCGNNDDHARNQALFVTEQGLKLTPAYDICPQILTGGEQTQGMAIRGQDRSSRLQVCLDAAPRFLLSRSEAAEIIERQAVSIVQNWPGVCEEAGLPPAEENKLKAQSFLREPVFGGLGGGLGGLASLRKDLLSRRQGRQPSGLSYP